MSFEPAPRPRPRPRCGRAVRARGVTLVELLVAMTILVAVTGMATLGSGATSGARLKRSATMVAGAVRVAYAHASAQNRPVRLVFDFESRAVSLEEASGPMLAVKRDRTGGAAAATEAEKAAQEEADAILKGPRAPRPEFRRSRAFGFDEGDTDKGIASSSEHTGKELSRGIRFASVETQHTDEPELQGRAYLYFWPGGQTERAAIVLTRGSGLDDDDDAFVTLLVSPLTGKTEILRGKHAMARPRSESEESEREDTGP